MSILRAPLRDLLNVEMPIIQAPIGPAAGPALAAAAFNAGGLGSITGGVVSGVAERVRQTRRLTDRPFALNLLLRKGNELERDVNERRERVKEALDEGAPACASFFYKLTGDCPAMVVSVLPTFPHLCVQAVAVSLLFIADSCVDCRPHFYLLSSLLN